jgi:NADP-dependent 3-hydroxy acid dehydrogenase YdfG
MSPSLVSAEASVDLTSNPTPQTQVNLAGKIIASMSKNDEPILSMSFLTQFLVTGANRGIGLGIAECCLQNGASKVYSIDMSDPGEEFAAILKKFPGKLLSVVANVTKESSITAAVDEIVSESGALHGMVVNAGRTNHKAALDFTQEDVEALFAVNVSLHFHSYLVHSRGVLSVIKQVDDSELMMTF